MRNKLAYTGKDGRRSDFVLDRDRAASPRDQWRRVATDGRSQLQPKPPRLSGTPDAAKTDVLACMLAPTAHLRKLHPTNLLERLDVEITRRTDVVGRPKMKPPSSRSSGPSCSNRPSSVLATLCWKPSRG